MDSWEFGPEVGVGCAVVGSMLSYALFHMSWISPPCATNSGEVQPVSSAKRSDTSTHRSWSNFCRDHRRARLLAAGVLLFCFDFAALVFAPLALVLPSTLLFFVWQVVFRVLKHKVCFHDKQLHSNSRDNPVHRVDIESLESRADITKATTAKCIGCNRHKAGTWRAPRSAIVVAFSSLSLAVVGSVFGPKQVQILSVENVVKTDVRSLLYGCMFVVVTLILFFVLRHLEGICSNSSRNCVWVQPASLAPYISAMISGLFGGQSVMCLKLAAEIVKTLVVTTSTVFSKVATYVLVVLAIIFAGIHLYTLRNTLVSVRGSVHRFHVAVVGYKLGFVLSAGIGAMVFLEELDSVLDPVQLGIYISGYVLSILLLTVEGYLQSQLICICTTSVGTRSSSSQDEVDAELPATDNINEFDACAMATPPTSPRIRYRASSGPSCVSDDDYANFHEAETQPDEQYSYNIVSGQQQSEEGLRQSPAALTWSEKLVRGNHAFPQPWWTMVPRDVMQGGSGLSDGRGGNRNGTCFWRDPGEEPDQWMVRGPTYLKDKVKVDSGPSRMAVVALEWSHNPHVPVRHAAGEHDGYLQTISRERKVDRPFVFVVNFMVPSLGNFVTYFARKPHIKDEVFDNMLLKFIEGDDSYRNARFKLIPGVKEGGFFVKRAVGRKPALVCSKLAASYHRGENYFEVCIDVGSSRIGASIMGAVKGYASGLVLHMGFVIESKTTSELPERILGGVDIHNPVMQPPIDHPVQPPREWVQHFASRCSSRGSISSHQPDDVFVDIDSGSESDSDSSVSSTGYESPMAGGCQEFEVTGNSHAYQCHPITSPKRSKPNYGYVQPDSMVCPRGAPNPHAPAGSSCWIDAGNQIGNFRVRGKTYLTDKVKVNSDISYMEPVALEWTYRPSEPLLHVSSVPGGFIQQQHVNVPNRPFLLVVNFAVPTVGNYVTYFAKRRTVDDDAVMEKALQDFIDGDDTYRNSRFKLIPSVLEGSFIVRKAVGTKPALLCSKLHAAYFAGDNYFEISIDVGSSRIGAGIMGTVKGFATSLGLRLGFLIEGKTEAELPERMLGGVDIFNPVMKPAPGLRSTSASVGARGSNTGRDNTEPSRSKSVTTEVALQ